MSFLDQISRRLSDLQQAAIRTIGDPTRKAIANPKKAPAPVRPAAEYIKHQVVAPIVSAGKRSRQAKGPIDQGVSLLETLGGMFSLTPAGIVSNVGVGGAAGAIRSARTKEALLPSIRRGATNPTSIGKEGLGISNPLLAAGVDLVLARNPKSIINDPLMLKSTKNALRPKLKDQPPTQALTSASQTFDDAPGMTQSAQQGKRPASVLADFYADMSSGSKARDTARQTAKGPINQRVRSQLVDRLSPVYDFVGLSRNAGKTATENNPYRKMRLLSGISGKVDAFIDQNLAPVIKREKGRLADVSALLAFDRERELIGNGLTRRRSIADLDQGVAELQAKHGPEGFATLQQSAKEVRQVGSKLLDELYDSGVIGKQSYDALKAKGQFYTPFEAIEHIADSIDKGYGTGSFNVATQDVVKRIGDYQGAIADPLESLLRKIPKVIALTEKNRAMKSLVDLRNEAPDVYRDLIVPVKGSEAIKGMGAINVFEDGKNVRYAVPDVVEAAIKNLDAESANILVSIGSAQAKILRAGATGLNIAFIPVNIVRDVQDALTTELTENGAVAMLGLLSSYPRAIMAAAKKDDLYHQWLAAGGAQSTLTEQIFQNPTRTVRDLTGERSLIKTLINSPRTLVEYANRVGEQSTRLARYQSGLERGESVAEAAFKSRDISLDFAKAGNTIKVLNQVVPFLNAGIQGTEKLLRMYRQNPQKAALYTGLVFGTPAVMLYRYNSQFADFDDIPTAERQNNWIIITRDRTPEERAAGEKVIGVKVPKGFLGRMVANTVDASLDFVRQSDPASFGEAMLQIAAGVSPVGLPYNKEELGQTLSTVLPPGLKAGVEGVTNTNLHFGTDIVPKSLERLPAREQYKATTPGVFKAAGQVTGVSPLILENTANTMTGGLGRQVAGVFSGDLEGATVGSVARRFAGIQGGKQADAAYEDVRKEQEYTASRNNQIRKSFQEGNSAEFDRLTANLTTQQINSILQTLEDREFRKGLTREQRAYQSLSKEERARLGQDRPELRADLELVDQAGAANKPLQLTASEKINVDRVKARVKESGEPEKFKSFLYVPSGNTAKPIALDPTVAELELTGREEIDKSRAKDHNKDVNAAIAAVLTLNKYGELDDDAAEEKIQELKGELVIFNSKGKIIGLTKDRASSGGGTGSGKRRLSTKQQQAIIKRALAGVNLKLPSTVRKPRQRITLEAPKGSKAPRRSTTANFARLASSKEADALIRQLAA